MFNEDFVFLCDNKNAPYGNKSLRKLKKITKNNIDYLVAHYQISICVIACNTISYTIGEELQNEYKDIKIVLTKFDEKRVKNLSKDILFFATKNTIKNNKYIQTQIREQGNFALYIKNLPKNIDKNIKNLEKIDNYIKKPLSNKRFRNVKTIVLGCTHFCVIKNNIKKFLPDIDFYEYECEVAQKVMKLTQSQTTSTFEIVLTNFDYKTYLQLKTYLFDRLKAFKRFDFFWI